MFKGPQGMSLAGNAAAAAASAAAAAASAVATAAAAVAAAAADFIMLYVGELPSCPGPCLDCPAYLIRKLKPSHLSTTQI